jgi:uncharacterized protein YjdB
MEAYIMWGWNLYGQLGDGTVETKYSPVKVMDNVVSVSTGLEHSGAITEDGSLYMWGYNYSGEIGDGTKNVRCNPVLVLENVVSVSLGGGSSAAITEDGSLYMWGSNSNGQLGDGTNEDRTNPVKVLENVVKVSKGNGHTGAITEDGSLYMWGWNCCGQLGDGTTTSRRSPVKVFDNVVSFSIGSVHSGAITEDRSLYMWGRSNYGQLGTGTGGSSYSPIKVMDHIKINNTTTSASVQSLSLLSSGSIISDSSNRNLEKPETVVAKITKLSAFENLTPNATYTFYVMRDKQADNPLGSSNLLYITQATADEDGKLSVNYLPTETVSDAEAFVVKSEQEDISAATVSLSNLEYNGTQQYAQPTVTLNGQTLSEGEDYELLGDYSAQEIGDYSLTVQGIGAYTSTVTVSYKVYGEGSCPVQSINLNKATASLNPKGTLQLTVTVLPEEGSNKELSWTSNNSEIASVDQNGMVTAVAEGTATITVTAQDGSGVSAKCVVTVVKTTAGDNDGNGTNSGGGTSGGGASGGGTSGGSTSGGSSSGGGASGGTASGGSTSGGGLSSEEVTETVSEVKDSNPNADDSASVEKNTTTNPDGSETVTTVRKSSDGSVKTVQTTTSKDGTVEKITLKVSADGSVSLVRTNTSGSTKTTEKYTSAGKNSNVTLSKLTTNAKSVSIPATVKVNGTSYKVTKIAANAFKNNKKITKIIIGKNITKIGKNAFYGASNLKTVIIKSTSISSIGKNAFKNVKKTATIKLSGTASQRAKLKKLIQKSGIAKTVKIKKA